jgi:phosphatidylglycerophosphatase C
MEVIVAAFDVDNTLTVRDCVVPFTRRVAGSLSLASAIFRRPVGVAKMLFSRDRDGLKAYFVSVAFAGRNVEDVAETAAIFAAEVANGWMRPDVSARLRWHQEQGHLVVLVSASLQPYLDVLGDLLEVDAVLCTNLEDDGVVYTGQILGGNCRGGEKVARLQQWCESANVPFSSVRYAYGDSSGDHQMLAAVENGVLVKSIELTRVPA